MLFSNDSVLRDPNGPTTGGGGAPQDDSYQGGFGSQQAPQMQGGQTPQQWLPPGASAGMSNPSGGMTYQYPGAKPGQDPNAAKPMWQQMLSNMFTAAAQSNQQQSVSNNAEKQSKDAAALARGMAKLFGLGSGSNTGQ